MESDISPPFASLLPLWEKQPHRISKKHRYVKQASDWSLPIFLVPSIHAVLAPNLWAVPTQPYSRHEKWCWSLRATRSTITGLPSGSPASRSTSFRSGAFGVGVGTAHGCTWRVGGTSAHPRSASDPSFGVRSRIHPHMRVHGPVRNTFTRGPAPASAASARSRLSRDLRPRG